MAIEIDRDNDKNPVVSLREIASEAVDADILQERFIRSMQKNLIKEDVNLENDASLENLENDASLEEEFAAYLNENEKDNQPNENLIFNKMNSEEDGSFVDVSEEFLKNED